MGGRAPVHDTLKPFGQTYGREQDARPPTRFFVMLRWVVATFRNKKEEEGRGRVSGRRRGGMAAGRGFLDRHVQFVGGTERPIRVAQCSAADFHGVGGADFRIFFACFGLVMSRLRWWECPRDCAPVRRTALGSRASPEWSRRESIRLWTRQSGPRRGPSES